MAKAMFGYGKNVEYVTMDDPQPSPKHLFKCMDAVQRLNVSGVL